MSQNQLPTFVLPPGRVYIIRAEGTSFVKIGQTSKDPKERLAQLRTGSPFALRLEIAFPFADPAKEEAEVHQMLAAFNTSGEWFDVPEEVLDSTKRHLYEGSKQELIGRFVEIMQGAAAAFDAWDEMICGGSPGSLQDCAFIAATIRLSRDLLYPEDGDHQGVYERMQDAPQFFYSGSPSWEQMDATEYGGEENDEVTQAIIRNAERLLESWVGGHDENRESPPSR